MIIFGFKSYLTVLAIATLVCQRCQNPAAHRLQKVQRRFTLFFVPLFPVSTTYLLDCTFCGQQSKLTRDQADAIAHPGGSAQVTGGVSATTPPPPSA